MSLPFRRTRNSTHPFADLRLLPANSSARRAAADTELNIVPATSIRPSTVNLAVCWRPSLPPATKTSCGSKSPAPSKSLTLMRPGEGSSLSDALSPGAGVGGTGTAGGAGGGVSWGRSVIADRAGLTRLGQHVAEPPADQFFGHRPVRQFLVHFPSEPPSVFLQHFGECPAGEELDHGGSWLGEGRLRQEPQPLRDEPRVVGEERPLGDGVEIVVLRFSPIKTQRLPSVTVPRTVLGLMASGSRWARI